VGRFLIWLSGAQRDILDECRTDRAKYVGVGGAVLVTSVMAAISMAFALHIALKATVPVAMPFAIAWGLAIATLDRWLVVSMTRHQLWLAIPRVVLGLLFGVIISTPLTLQIFHVEIANRISLDQTSAASAFQASLKSNALYLKVVADRQAVAKDQAVINSGGGAGMNPADDPVLIQLNAQLKEDQAQQARYLAAMRCEEGDPPSKNCTPGKGPAFVRDSQNYQTYTLRVHSDQSQIAAEQSSLKGKNAQNATSALINARANLAVDQAKLSLDQKALTTLENSFNATNAANSGILASLKALEELRSSDATLFLAELLLFLFFTSIECLPIGVKMLLNLGPENTYEKAVAKAEQVGLRRAEEEMARQHMEAIRQQDQLTAESERLNMEWEMVVLPDLIREQVAARERLARARLARWERRAAIRRDYDALDDRFGPGRLSTVGRPTADWTNVRRPRRGSALRARLAAAWRGFRQPRGPRARDFASAPPPSTPAAGYSGQGRV
jgi:hypothetical protein